jgi:hypothetical protein
MVLYTGMQIEDERFKRLASLLIRVLCMSQPVHRFRFYIRNVNDLLWEVLKESRVVWDGSGFKFKTISMEECEHTIRNIHITNFQFEGEVYTGLRYFIRSLLGVEKEQKKIFIPRKKTYLTIQSLLDTIVLPSLKYMFIKLSQPNSHLFSRQVLEASSLMISLKRIKKAFGGRRPGDSYDVESIPHGPMRAFLEHILRGCTPMECLEKYMETCNEYLTQILKTCSTRQFITQEDWREILKYGFRGEEFQINGKSVKGLHGIIRELLRQEVSSRFVRLRFLMGLRYNYLISAEFFPDSFQSNIEKIKAGGIEPYVFAKKFNKLYYDNVGIPGNFGEKRKYLLVNEGTRKRIRRE